MDDLTEIGFYITSQVVKAAYREDVLQCPKDLETFIQFIVRIFVLTRSQPSRPVRAADLVALLCHLAENGDSDMQMYARKTAVRLTKDT